MALAAHTVEDYLNNEKWVGRVRAAFDMIDINKNGTLEEADWMGWVENIKRDVNPDAGLSGNLTKAMGNFTSAMGVTQGKKLNKDEYVKASAAMVVAEKAKKDSRKTKAKEHWAVTSMRHGTLWLIRTTMDS